MEIAVDWLISIDLGCAALENSLSCCCLGSFSIWSLVRGDAKLLHPLLSLSKIPSADNAYSGASSHLVGRSLATMGSERDLSLCAAEIRMEGRGSPPSIRGCVSGEGGDLPIELQPI